ncbi:MAG: queuosine precursor transporter [Candidatus Izimaplasma sp.]|nr:queuosine precursor transporter [Candidatus Izimaplasma bacterium]
MSNEILWLVFALVNFLMIVLSYKFFGKTGLFAWIAMGTILANIQVTKTIDFDFFGIHLVATLGNIMYGTLFLVTDALSEKYGIKDAKKAVYIGFFSLLATVIIMQFSIWFIPNIDDFAHDSIVTIFSVLPRIALASLSAYIVSQLIDVHVFQKIKKIFPEDKYLWIRNNGSTLFSQLIDTSIFVPIAFLGVYESNIVLSIFITTYVIKVIVAFLDTPFVYLFKYIKPLQD